MKKFFLGLISGILLTAILANFSAIAETAQLAFNSVAIVINGVPVTRWGENFTLADGTEVPFSIVYNGTTYLPMRKMAELLRNDIFWNGDSRTVSLNDRIFWSWQETVVAEEADANGNIWRYSVRFDSENGNFLVVTDETRDFTRAYRLANSGNQTDLSIPNHNVFVDDDGIYFVRLHGFYEETYLYKISFLNDQNSQDGERIANLGIRIGQAVIENGYVYYSQAWGLNARRDVLHALNWRTGESTELFSTYIWRNILNLRLSGSNNGYTILNFDIQNVDGPWTSPQIRIIKGDTLDFEIIE